MKTMHSSNHSIVLFDGFCHLCSRTVRFIIKRDKKKIFSFIPLQSEVASKIQNLPVFDKTSPPSIILIEKDKIYQYSSAVLHIARHLRFPWNLFYVFIIIPAFIRDAIYMFVSRNRYKWFGRRESCMVV
jgi:predicted DCC family thiol-disulfide oxidoreductase YuxK